MRYISYCFSTLLLLFILSSCGSESTPVYNLTTTPTPEEAGTVSPSTGEYDEGEDVEITATPNTDWIFDGWEGDASGSDNPTSITMDGDKDIAATFVLREYPLTIETEGEGTVHEQVMKQKTSEYEHGTVVQLTAKADEGWTFSQWEGDLESENEVEVIEIDDAKTVTAVFERIDYALTINIEGEGEVSEEVVQVKSTDYPYKTIVELTATPSTGWVFTHWEGDLTGEENPTQIEIDNAKEVGAIFESRTIYLSSNGMTIMCPDGEIGETGTVSGITYEIVDDNLLMQRLSEGHAPSKLCVSQTTTMENLFNYFQVNQDISGWDVSNVTDMSGMFKGNNSLNQNDIGDIGIWDVSNVVDMSEMFGHASFDQDISGWDVSNVTDMNSMFRENSLFDQDIGGWDVRNVTNMSFMFYKAQFNKDISDWDVSNVTDMYSMFRENFRFNQDISGWDVSNVTDMNSMFRQAQSFNQDIGKWDVSNVTNMNGLFAGRFSFAGTTYHRFNQDISGWDVSNVTDMSNMFNYSDFNQDISGWDVSNVTSMSRLFSNTPFNQDISGWDVSNVTDMNSMFSSSSFIQDIGSWNVSNVTQMRNMFSYSPFNRDISSWDVSNATEMRGMFASSPFNQNISSWCVSNIDTEPNNFSTSSPLEEDHKPIWGTCPN